MMQKYVPAEQLKKKFGGSIDDLEADFYSPLSTAFMRKCIPAESINVQHFLCFTTISANIFSNVVVQQTTPAAYPFKMSQSPLRVERPLYKGQNY